MYVLPLHRNQKNKTTYIYTDTWELLLCHLASDYLSCGLEQMQLNQNLQGFNCTWTSSEDQSNIDLP